ncbi:MAG: hypothetical protein Q9218_004016 [Villophora microphyllina]
MAKPEKIDELVADDEGRFFLGIIVDECEQKITLHSQHFTYKFNAYKIRPLSWGEHTDRYHILGNFEEGTKRHKDHLEFNELEQLIQQRVVFTKQLENHTGALELGRAFSELPDKLAGLYKELERIDQVLLGFGKRPASWVLEVLQDRDGKAVVHSMVNGRTVEFRERQ